MNFNGVHCQENVKLCCSQRGTRKKTGEAISSLRSCCCGKFTFWSLGGDLSSLLSQTRHEDRTWPWLSAAVPSSLRGPDPPEHQNIMFSLSEIFFFLKFSLLALLYHCITGVVAENHDVNGRRVISHADSSLFGYVFPEFLRRKTKSERWICSWQVIWRNSLWERTLTCCDSGWWLKVLEHRFCSKWHEPIHSAKT